MIVLIADQSQEARSALCALLHKADPGISVVEVEDGGEALAALAATPRPNLAIFAYQMPVVDGFTCLRAARERGIEAHVVSDRPAISRAAMREVRRKSDLKDLVGGWVRNVRKTHPGNPIRPRLALADILIEAPGAGVRQAEG